MRRWPAGEGCGACRTRSRAPDSRGSEATAGGIWGGGDWYALFFQ